MQLIVDSVTCDIFQIYFHYNLFNPDKNCKIQNKTKLNKSSTNNYGNNYGRKKNVNRIMSCIIF